MIALLGGRPAKALVPKGSGAFALGEFRYSWGMIATPIVALAGKARSGKDTVGTFIASHYNGTCIGQADRMKKFCMDVFGFSEEALWGPSELREEPVSFDRLGQSYCQDRFDTVQEAFLTEVLPADVDPIVSFHHLEDWMTRLVTEMWSKGVLTPRHVLQTLGTEWGRGVALDMWNQYTLKAARALLAGGHSYTRAGGLVKEPGNIVDYVIVTDGRFQNEILNVRYLGGVALKIERTAALSGPAGASGHASETELDRIPKHFFTRVISNNASMEDLFATVRRLMQEVYGDLRG